jgi:hypothetical protein
MIAALVLALASPAPAAEGIHFRCGPGRLALEAGLARGGFDLFVPSAASAAAGGHHKVSLAGAWKLEAAAGAMPGPLTLSWRREHNSPVVLVVRDYDPASGAARYTLSGELNPASRLFTPVVTHGHCAARGAAPSDQEPSR